ncbi:hypothetical protein FACS189432_08310 [Bacteroidia bacterium]|nr:hypothetical protein FACS189432_08310 [Bacteroidia bacterium]GHV70176.1 hypothetical protein FACS189420_0190 [Bacteroidia bacterium]
MNINNIPKLSFCITCKNRFYQVSRTLPKNLDDNRMYKQFVEFILIDFGSADGLFDWIRKNHAQDIKDGYLKYYYTDSLPYWHVSIAKNTAHSLASHEILVNLDCDNYTGHNGGKFVIQRFIKYGDAVFIHQFSKKHADGSYGRICVLKKHFMQIRGYDENFEPMGHEDSDLMKRLTKLGLCRLNIPNPNYNKAIANSKEESIRNTCSKLSWEEMDEINIEKSNLNIQSGRIIANLNAKSIGIESGIYNFYEKHTIQNEK